MNCDKCESNRIFRLNAKASDCFYCEFGGEERDGYAPGVENICGGDYAEFSVCLDCGKIQGQFPVRGPDFG